MQFTIERGALLKALGHVQNVVERRNTIPILSNVLLSAERGQVSFSATDLDMEIVDTAEATVSIPGQITAPAHTLYEIVRKLPDGADVELKYSAGDDPRLAVSAGRSRFALPVLPAGDFPIMSSDHEGVSFSILRDDLKRLIDKTRFAVSTEETRYYLNGMYLHTLTEDGSNYLRAVATDGHRLALAEMPAPDGSAGGPGVIIPRKTIDQARRLLDDGTGYVDLTISPAKIRFQLGNASLTSKIIDGSFPDYGRVIPKNNDKIMMIDTGILAKAVDRVSTISAEKSRSVKMAIEPGRLTLSVRNIEAGQAVEEAEIDYDSDSIDIGFNARYILDVMGQIGGEQVELRFADASSPTLVLDPADNGVQYVLMPLRV
ncbi:DNA polymerase III subunit beta [Asticcacaulis sp. AC460]|uniref:DNA polymerase III subunit beta n=1 Tax=Asticcacaulis sp. AC460 TaxID=1282360 RepID=UPI0003C3AC09|nr:DNA polymerase III subunit beta [Asticcacaulis sp. AC460]ESQ86798.1 DNA polymerase III subunit beta [Asticcacaulis sp. AC460]